MSFGVREHDATAHHRQHLLPRSAVETQLVEHSKTTEHRYALHQNTFNTLEVSLCKKLYIILRHEPDRCAWTASSPDGEDGLDDSENKKDDIDLISVDVTCVIELGRQ